MTENYTFDRPVSGDIQQSHRSNSPQASPEEFLAVVDEILATPGVLAIGWSQYTPYFNDGETCEFGVNDLALKLDPEVFGEVEDDDAYEFPDDENWVTSYGIFTYGASYRDKTYALNGVDTHYLEEVFSKWRPSAFESVALTNFGDHATVVATPEGFNVEFNEHE